jgi:hypothetical protein
MTTYHHVLDAMLGTPGSDFVWSIGLLLIPIAKAVLAAWPEYRYATSRCVSVTKDIPELKGSYHGG